MPLFICPNCKQRSVDIDGVEGFTDAPLQCRHCGFGFLFEILEDYYPGPNTGFIVCDRETRVIAVGEGVFELTGFDEKTLMGCDLRDALALANDDGEDPAAVTLEWGVRKLGERARIRVSSGNEKAIVADFFPAYDEDGGLLVAISPA